ncbi:MAG: Leucine-tRNA ligase, partial [Parcubacteria group bacterium GW2011_GWC2_42_13]
PVNLYIGGAEHAVLHLLYSRFFTKVLKDLGYLDFDEPFLKMRHQGIILGQDGQKMSKSRGNVVDPDDLVKNFGSDAVRMYLCFMGPYSQGGPWNPSGINGVFRFLNRVWQLKSKFQITNNKQISNSNDQNPKLEKILHQSVKKITEDIENLRFNTAVSQLMILLNEMERAEGLGIKDYETFLKLLAPFAPHLAEELWRQKTSIHLSAWPKYDPKKIKEETFELVVQVNGKVRERVKAPVGLKQAEAEELALGLKRVKERVAAGAVKKIIFVPGRLVNIVTD